jgi:cytochrome b6-f complex iron-sulfur subunit
MESKRIPLPRRRFFLMVLLGGIGATLGAAGLWPVWRYLSPQAVEGERAQVAIPRARVEVGQAHFFQFRGHPAVVLQRSPGVFFAFSAICTHLGCIVQWLPEKGEFLCPCHAGRFAGDGKVLGGPPPKPLQPIPVALAGDDLLVG